MTRVLILSWEYPPLIEGGLARHVRKLAEQLVAVEDLEVHVLTRGDERMPAEDELDALGAVHDPRVARKIRGSNGRGEDEFEPGEALIVAIDEIAAVCLGVGTGNRKTEAASAAIVFALEALE